MLFSILLSAAHGNTSPGLGLGPAQPATTRLASAVRMPKYKATRWNLFMGYSSSTVMVQGELNRINRLTIVHKKRPYAGFFVNLPVCYQINDQIALLTVARSLCFDSLVLHTLQTSDDEYCF
jgi:hypothetical protein